MNIKETVKLRDIENHEGLYQVSNTGQVYSIRRDMYLAPVERRDGYVYVQLYKDGLSKIYSIHSLVAKAFLGHDPENTNLVVDHKNDIKTDNRSINIQLLTQRDNVTKYYKNKKTTSKYTGVYKRGNKWTTSIHVNGKTKYLGRYEVELEASLVYQAELIKIQNENKYN